ncbi:MAG: VTT domain-containing protein [Clostridia bacterium]|jgi:uncharacterized membrane protein YdjX (TVP38/TMEM64 family)|nr:VTT domain-containing protein [Clostridia bacterium]
MSGNITSKVFTAFSFLSLAACIIFSLYAYHKQLFTSQTELQTYIMGFGVASALIFIVFQVVQVVLPILPGGLSCLGGVLLFGPWVGLLYNYVGICIGSIAAFFIARNCGKPILYSLFNEKTIKKYEKWTGEGSKFNKWFAIAIFIPIAPDDFLCYLAGTTQMNWKKFIAIILLGKPFAIASYSLFLYTGLKHIITFIH